MSEGSYYLAEWSISKAMIRMSSALPLSSSVKVAFSSYFKAALKLNISLAADDCFFTGDVPSPSAARAYCLLA